jgi:hypothetical protein
MRKNRDNIKFEHDQRLGEIFVIRNNMTGHIPDCIVWICELTGDYLLARYGENIPTLSISAGAHIVQTSDNTYIIR